MSSQRQKSTHTPQKNKLIWLDNYGAGNNANPLEVHTYWNEIIKLEEKSKKYHKEQNQQKHKQIYNQNPFEKTQTNEKQNKTRFAPEFGQLLVVPTNSTVNNLSDLLKYKHRYNPKYQVPENALINPEQTEHIQKYYAQKIGNLHIKDDEKRAQLEQTFLQKTGGMMSNSKYNNKQRSHSHVDKVKQMEKEIAHNKNLRKLAEAQLSQLQKQKV